MKLSRLEVLNRLAAQLRARTYLEIGVQTGIVFRSVHVPMRVGVDPDPTSAATRHMTSDAFFAMRNEHLSTAGAGALGTFDLIFIDGLHHAEQVAKDAANALRCLTPGGVIVFHDCDPPTETSQRREIADPGCWCGDTWRAWVALNRALDATPGLSVFTVDTDLGLGVVSTSPLFPVPTPGPVEPVAMPYKTFRANRFDLLKLWSVQWFLECLPSVEPIGKVDRVIR